MPPSSGPFELVPGTLPVVTQLGGMESAMPWLRELASGPEGAEDVFLRGADLELRHGEQLLLSGLSAVRRRTLAELLAGSRRPRYGIVHRVDGAEVAVVDAGGDATAADVKKSFADRAGKAVVLLAERVSGDALADRHRAHRARIDRHSKFTTYRRKSRV